MPAASITVNSTPRELDQFVVQDTGDYTGLTITSTVLTVTDPTNTEYTINIFPDNFASINDTYTITTSVLNYPSNIFPDGTYSFVLTATASDMSTLVSPTVYFLMDMNTKLCWVDRFELCLKQKNCFSDEEKEIRTDVRELIQAAEEHFAQFRYSLADKALTRALNLCQKSPCVN